MVNLIKKRKSHNVYKSGPHWRGEDSQGVYPERQEFGVGANLEFCLSPGAFPLIDSDIE